MGESNATVVDELFQIDRRLRKAVYGVQLHLLLCCGDERITPACCLPYLSLDIIAAAASAAAGRSYLQNGIQ